MAAPSLSDVRRELAVLEVDAFICGSQDAHQSEYTCDRDLRRAFLSGFTGSAGTALVLPDKALLWTDGRYFLQAETELSADWTLMRSGEVDILEMDLWIGKNMPSGSKVGVDASLISADQAISLSAQLEKTGISLTQVKYNPIDKLWGVLQPLAPTAPALVMINHGQDHVDKITTVQTFLKANGADAFCASMLDEIAWLFNIRGSDVECNPVMMAYAVITIEDAHLFCDMRKLGTDVIAHLNIGSVKLHSYESVQEFVTGMQSTGKRISVDKKQINWGLYNAAGSNTTLPVTSPLTMAKSLKNDIELNGIREAHIRDGVALTAFLCWLDKKVRATPNMVTEYQAAEELEKFRSAMYGHKYPSFATIAGYGPNGAIIHYKPEATTSATIGTDSLFLLDSGGQYIDGTTDVTRTNCYGEASAHMKACYTLVLKGHIALARLIFPEGTIGSRIDAVARMPLWQAGLDYNHGTGHGVGAFLNVHEGPQGIGYRKRENEEGFRIGMTTSNEPGYYENGNFGVRIENVCITVEAQTSHHFNNRRYCQFETVTMTPINTELINVDMLNSDEVSWLNDYHKNCRTKLLPGIQEHFPEAIDFLIASTEPL